MQLKRPLDKVTQKKRYVLLIIDAPEIEDVHQWFRSNAPKYPFEKVFVADIKTSNSLQKPVGFTALIKFNSTEEMKTTLLDTTTEIHKYKDWKCNFMMADWIEIKGLERVSENMVRSVTTDGRISFQHHRYFVTNYLRGEKVDLKLNGENLEIYYQGALVKTHRLAEQEHDKTKGEGKC